LGWTLSILIPRERRRPKALSTGDDGRIRRVAAAFDAAEDTRDRRLGVEFGDDVCAIPRPLGRVLLLDNARLFEDLRETCAMDLAHAGAGWWWPPRRRRFEVEVPGYTSDHLAQRTLPVSTMARAIPRHRQYPVPEPPWPPAAFSDAAARTACWTEASGASR